MKLLRLLFIAMSVAPLTGQASLADSLVLSGSDLLDGSFTSSQIAAEATASNTVTYNGYTGVSLWSFLGGSDTTVSTTTAAGTTKNYGSITTFNPTGANANPNYDFRYYVVGTGSNGAQTAVSIGQIDPAFTGSNISATPFVAFQTSGGTQLTTPVLVVPGGPAGSTVQNLTSLSVQSVPAVSGPGGVSTGVAVSGNVTSPATYSSFPGTFTPVTVNAITKSGPTETYTGIPLATLLNVPSTVNVNSQIVIATGTDGYQVVYSLDELLNADGTANANDILAYAASGSDFPTDSIARTILAGDGPKPGRFVSNLDSLEVVDVAQTPIPASLSFFAAGIFMIGLLKTLKTRREILPL